MSARRFKNLNVVSSTAGARAIDPTIETHARPTLVGANKNKKGDVLLVLFFVVAMIVFAERNRA